MFLSNSGQTAEFDTVTETGAPDKREFTVKIEVQGQEVYGVGRSLKFAKQDAAEKVLLKFFNFKCETKGIISIQNAFIKITYNFYKSVLPLCKMQNVKVNSYFFFYTSAV